ncbi:MAG: hypothetical protein ACJ77K_12410 [Bacteroidia bacterium]
MAHKFGPFFLKLAVFSLFTLGVLLLWQHVASVHFQTDLWWAIWLFFIVTSALIHVILVRASARDPRKFVTNFMGMTAMKLFGYLLIIIAYGLASRDTAQGFIICFLISYFLYSGFEVVTLIRHFKK